MLSFCPLLEYRCVQVCQWHVWLPCHVIWGVRMRAFGGALFHAPGDYNEMSCEMQSLTEANSLSLFFFHIYTHTHTQANTH